MSLIYKSYGWRALTIKFEVFNSPFMKKMNITVLVLSVVAMCSCETFHIVPVNSTERCEEEPCLTLGTFAKEIVSQNFSNLTLYFTPGKHRLDQNLKFISIKNVKIIGHLLGSWISLVKNNLTIFKVQSTVITNIKFNGSPGNVYISQCKNLLLVKCTVFMVDLTLTLDNHFISCAGLGNLYNDSAIVNLVAVNFFSKLAINHDSMCSFVFINSCQFTISTVTISEAEIVAVINSTFSHNIPGQRSILQCDYFIMTNCTIEYSRGEWDEVYATYGITADTVVHISNSNFSYYDHGRFEINSDGKIFITNCKFEEFGNIVLDSTDVVEISSSSFEEDDEAYISLSIFDGDFEIIDSVFTGYRISGSNYLKAVIEIQPPIEPRDNSVSVFRNTMFVRNCGTSGAGVVSVSGRTLKMQNTTFIGNSGYDELVLIIFQSTLFVQSLTFEQNEGYIYLFNSRVYFTGPVTISGNIGGGIHAFQSQIHINSTETTVISNNTASSGGGIMLRVSELVIQSPIIISENTARVFGGGIICL